MRHEERIGRIARVYYKGGATGEEPIDDHSQGDPEEVVLGVGELPKGIDDAFMSMDVGEKRTIVIAKELGFGDHDPKGVQTYPRVYADAFANVQVGDYVAWRNPVSGSAIPVLVIEADEQLITVDFNHPFAGKELTYWVHLVDIL